MSLDIFGKIPTNECKCPTCGHDFTQYQTVIEENITHNTKKMANQAGLLILWECAGLSAWKVIVTIEEGLHDLKNKPEVYEPLGSKNGWGTRLQFIDWLENLLRQLNRYPQAELWSHT